MFVRLQEHAKLRGSYLRSHCDALIAKVASFEQRLLAETYTPDSVLRLDSIARDLASSLEAAETASHQVCFSSLPEHLP